jgi:TP901 family phage tail tape measure protein
MNKSTRRAMITIGLDDRELERDLAAARRKVRKGADDMNKPGRRDKGGKGFGFGAAAGVGIGVVDRVGDFISGTVDDLLVFENGLSRLQIASGKSNAEMAALRSSILDVSKATGIAAGDILVGNQTYIDLTGDVAGAEAAMSSFARIAQASGASVSDIATATAALKESMGLDPRDIEAAFSGLIQQGKAGAVSLKDLAGELSAVAPRFAKFGGSGLLGIADLGAALQVARKGFGSAGEAATGLEALMGALSMNAAKFEKANVKIFTKGKDGKKTFRGFVDIIDQIGKSKLVKDPTALAKAFGSKEAAQAFDMLSANRQELEKIYSAGLDAGAVQRDLDTRLAGPAGKIAIAMNAAKISVAEAFTPERIEKFAEALGKSAEWFAKIVGYADRLSDFIVDDPFEGETAAKFASTGLTHTESGDQRSRADAQKLIQKAARGEEVDSFNMNAAQTPELRKRAAAIAASELGLMSDGSEDPWNRTGSGPVASEASSKAFVEQLGKRLELAIAKGMANAPPTTLKTESNTIAKTVNNAPANRQPKR